MEIDNQVPSNNQTSAENFASLAGRVYLGTRELQEESLTKGEAILRGAMVVEPERYFPTRIGPKELYTKEWIEKNTVKVQEWYTQNQHDAYDIEMMALHDGAVKELFLRLYGAKKIIGVMGGTSEYIPRTSANYKNIARICRTLAVEDFVIATGGGDGAMEAANLGAKFAMYSAEQLEEALTFAEQFPAGGTEPEDVKFYKALFDKWPKQSINSFASSTWTYTDNNWLCRYQARFFSDAVAEFLLVDNSNCGMIFAPGGPGTRFECGLWMQNQAYAAGSGTDFAKPSVFLNTYYALDSLYPSEMNFALRDRAKSQYPENSYCNSTYMIELGKENQHIVDIFTQFANRYYPNGVSSGIAPIVPKVDPSKCLPVNPTQPELVKAQQAAKNAVTAYVTKNHMTIGIGSAANTLEYVVAEIALLAEANDWTIHCVPATQGAQDIITKYVSTRVLGTDVLDKEQLLHGLDVTFGCGVVAQGEWVALQGEDQSLGNLRTLIQSTRSNSFVLVNEEMSEEEGASHDYRSYKLPIEVQPLTWAVLADHIKTHCDAEEVWRLDAGSPHTPFVTDATNFVLIAQFSVDQNLEEVVSQLANIAGVYCVGAVKAIDTYSG